MGWKPGSVKKEEAEQKIREEDAAAEAQHEAQHQQAVREIKNKTPINMAPDGDPKVAKGQTEGSMTQWMFTVDNHIAELMGDVKQVRTLLQTLVMQVNRGQEKLPVVLPPTEAAPKKQTAEEKAKAEKTAAEVLANNKHKNGKPPPVVDVPTLEVLAAQMNKYIKKHGKGALETRLLQYDVKKASDIPEEKRHLFLADIAT